MGVLGETHRTEHEVIPSRRATGGRCACAQPAWHGCAVAVWTFLTVGALKTSGSSSDLSAVLCEWEETKGNGALLKLQTGCILPCPSRNCHTPRRTCFSTENILLCNRLWRCSKNPHWVL